MTTKNNRKPAPEPKWKSRSLALGTCSGIVYGQSYFWTKLDGATMTGFTYGHASKESALAAIRDILLPLGWTAPRWWQISRWSDAPRSFPNEKAQTRSP